MAHLTHPTLSGYEMKHIRCPQCGCVYVEVRRD
jgi:hypothetical protein